MGEIYNEKPDLILLDLKMGQISGVDLLSMIKSDSNYSDIKIIIVTAFVNKELEKTMFEIGMDNIIHKPFAPDILIEKVAKALIS